ncbi:hypothetical protein PC129_g19992 [Phytophthora cactorum]|nr:hypothetical protein PC112_g6283 [Phytophthora cactorum]KAG2882739.1 hypothetical protein PC114_g20869 [Phytophthora cactorum]KAG2964185.1 hypothetical protein PC118_g20476 [Phytophthora cactorum]KAG3208989.1 hypothetical protein PC129_g19992 [Phytophthora cactorum]RAW29648.1 hypothetical protein PC110_g13997 [Phytophthora cactorum]
MIPMAPNLRSVSEASPAEGQRLSIRLDSKLNQVVPVGSRNKRPDSTTKRHLRGTPNQKLSCSEAFGSLGIPMALILVLCLVWTAWLLVVSLEPNKAANWLMDTRTYDNGQFWLIIDSNPELTRVGVASLMFVVFCYLFVCLDMFFWREKVFKPVIIRRIEARLLDSLSVTRLQSRTWSIVVGPSYRRIHSTWKDLTSFNGKKRKYG